MIRDGMEESFRNMLREKGKLEGTEVVEAAATRKEGTEAEAYRTEDEKNGSRRPKM